MTQREECRGTYIGVSECTRREEYDGIGGGSKWGGENTAVWVAPIAFLEQDEGLFNMYHFNIQSIQTGS